MTTGPMIETVSDAIGFLIAPVIVIPACGMLVLSISARLNAVVAHVRTMHQERIETYLRANDPDPRRLVVRAMRIEGLDHQVDRMLRRCRLMQHAIRLLYAAVIAMVVASLLLGIAIGWPVIERAALVTFAAGLVAVLAAMVVAIVEIGLALEAVTFEHDRVAALLDEMDDGDDPLVEQLLTDVAVERARESD